MSDAPKEIYVCDRMFDGGIGSKHIWIDDKPVEWWDFNDDSDELEKIVYPDVRYVRADEIERLEAERDEARRLAEQYRNDAFDIDSNPDAVTISRLPWEADDE